MKVLSSFTRPIRDGVTKSTISGTLPVTARSRSRRRLWRMLKSYSGYGRLASSLSPTGELNWKPYICRQWIAQEGPGTKRPLRVFYSFRTSTNGTDGKPLRLQFANPDELTCSGSPRQSPGSRVEGESSQHIWYEGLGSTIFGNHVS